MWRKHIGEFQLWFEKCSYQSHWENSPAHKLFMCHTDILLRHCITCTAAHHAQITITLTQDLNTLMKEALTLSHRSWQPSKADHGKQLAGSHTQILDDLTRYFMKYWWIAASKKSTPLLVVEDAMVCSSEPEASIHVAVWNGRTEEKYYIIRP